MTRNTISRFNRETVWLATGVLGTVVFAALVLAVQERQAMVTQAERGLLLNASPNSNAKMIPEPGSSVDPAPTETSLQEIPSAQKEPTASTPASVLAVTPEINRSAQRHDSARTIGPKIRNVRNRSSAAFRSVDVKRWLIELWHQSTAKSEKSRSWTTFSNLNGGVSRKAAYTAEMNQ